jgi:hypothetical protein
MTDITPPSCEPAATPTAEIPNYPVKIWEIFAVGLGGIALISLAVVVLANQFFTKMQNSQQAESIAHQVVDYQMPGGAKGLMSLSIGAERFALVGNRNNPSDVLMLITQTSIEVDTEDDPRNFAQELDLPSTLIGTWQSATETQRSLIFCQQPTPVTIRQGQFQLIDPKQPPQPTIEYVFQRSHQQTLSQIHLLTTGPDAAAKIQRVFKSLKCRQD